MPERLDEPPEFTDEELRAALKRVGEDARRAAFAAGLPVMVVQNGQLTLLYPDGTQRVTGSLSDAPAVNERP